MTTVDVQVREIVRRHLGLPHHRVVADANFERDLEADSLDKIELVLAVENAFNIDIPDDDVERVETVDQLAQLVKRLAVLS